MYDTTFEVWFRTFIDYVSRISYTTHFENKETGEIERVELTGDDFFEYNVGSRDGLMDSNSIPP